MVKANNGKLSVGLVGGGRVAAFLAYKLQQKELLQILIHRNPPRQTLVWEDIFATTVQKIPESGFENIDLWILAISDDSIPSVANTIHEFYPNAVVAHCSGAFQTATIASNGKNAAAIYPLLSFSGSITERSMDPPLLLSASSSVAMKLIEQIAPVISKHTYSLEDEKRLQVHTAAVFANNFTNLMYTIALDILHKNDLKADLLLPLIKQTSEKVLNQSPRLAQTGPALRNDQSTINAHLAILEEYPPSFKELYVLATKLIQELNQKEL